jgi:hypothetical protein
MNHILGFSNYATSLVDKNRNYDQYNPDNFKFVYDKDFLDKDDFARLSDELLNYEEDLKNSLDSRGDILRYNLPIKSEFVKDIIKKYESKIRQLTKNRSVYLSKNFPIELRKYTRGCFMSPHKDTQIYKLPQYECVFTISNTTDSVTKIEGLDISTIPNSILIVKAEGVLHEVTKVGGGERNFLKFIFTETDDFLRN